MNELAKNSSAITVKLNQVEHVLQNQPAFLCDYDEVYNEILIQVVKSINHLGWKIPADDDLQILVTEITNSIRNNYKTFRKEEAATCFAKGIRGEYGEFMGLSIVTFEKFIIAYLASSYRANLGKTLPVAEISAPSMEPTREQKFDLAASNAINAFLGYGKGKDISLVAPSVYRFLRKLALFSYEEQEQADFLFQAQREVIAQLKEKKAAVLDRVKRIEIGRQLENPQSLEHTIILHAQRLGLYAYFQTLIVEELDLKKILENKKKQVLGGENENR